jgi:hypothetical protein
VKEQVLDPGNRAALQALASLSGVIALSALLSSLVLARSGPRHRDAGYAAFEVFVVVVAATAAIFTAAICVVLLNRDEAISGSDLFRVSAPLLVSLVLLALLASAVRLSPAVSNLSSNLPILLATVFAAVVAGLAPGLMAPDPSEIVIVVAGILAIGMVLGWSLLLLERFRLLGKRKNVRERLERLLADGFVPRQCQLTGLIPNLQDGPDIRQFVCWIRKDRLFLDQTEARRLCEAVDQSWAELASGDAGQPLGETILTQCALKTTVLPWPPKFFMTGTIHQHGKSANAIHKLSVNERGLFDVTDLELFSEN